MSMHRRWGPAEAHTNTGLRCSAGFRLTTGFPTSTLVRGHPTPCLPSASAPVVPRLRPTLGRTQLLAASACVRVRADLGDSLTGAPRRRTSLGANRVSQVTGLSSCCVPCFQTPPGVLTARPLLVRGQHRRPQVALHPGHPVSGSFRGQLNTAHLLACLRIAGVVTSTVARLASGVGGLALRRAGLSPAGQQTRFHEVIAASNPPRPAFPGRTMPPSARVRSLHHRHRRGWLDLLCHGLSPFISRRLWPAHGDDAVLRSSANMSTITESWHPVHADYALCTSQASSQRCAR
jgi:hypothetical protein